jgi:hypothetical protein
MRGSQWVPHSAGILQDACSPQTRVPLGAAVLARTCTGPNRCHTLQIFSRCPPQTRVPMGAVLLQVFIMCPPQTRLPMGTAFSEVYMWIPVGAVFLQALLLICPPQMRLPMGTAFSTSTCIIYPPHTRLPMGTAFSAAMRIFCRYVYYLPTADTAPIGDCCECGR